MTTTTKSALPPCAVPGPDEGVRLMAEAARDYLNRYFGPGTWALIPTHVPIVTGMLRYYGILEYAGETIATAIGTALCDAAALRTAWSAARDACLVECVRQYIQRGAS